MAHPDLNQLLNYCIPFARQQLEAQGGFHPFGASLGADGSMAADGLQLDEERPAPNDLISAYTEAYQARAALDALRAMAICWDARVAINNGPEVDAIVTGLEHQNGECVTVFLPYERSPEGGYSYGEIGAGPREKLIFS